MGDDYSQHHSGSGDNIMNFGKQPFELNDDHLADVLSKVDRSKPVKIGWVGSNSGSPQVADAIWDYLARHGIVVEAGMTAEVMAPAIPEPITVYQGNNVVVDVTR